MSVSITEGNAVLDAIVAGGDEYLARIKAFGEAKTAADAGVKRLNIGNDVIRALQNAQAHEQTALDAIAVAKAEAADIIEKAKLQAAETVRLAQVDIDAMLNKARLAVDEHREEVRRGRETQSAWMTKTEIETKDLLARAQIVNAKADETHLLNEQRAAELAKAQVQAKAAQEEARDTQAALSARLNAIQAAAQG